VLDSPEPEPGPPRQPHNPVQAQASEPEDEEGVPPEPARTFASSHFKREYAKAGVVPIRHAHQVLSRLHTFLYTFVHIYDLKEEAEGRLELFLSSLQVGQYQYAMDHVSGPHEADRWLTAGVLCLQQQVAAHADGPANALLGEVGATAELLWTSDKTFVGMREFNRQLCSLLNRAIREDHAVHCTTIPLPYTTTCTLDRCLAVLSSLPGTERRIVWHWWPH
jgi:hypothetical protein